MNGISMSSIVTVILVDGVAIYLIALLAYNASLYFAKVNSVKDLTPHDHRAKASGWHLLAVAGLLGMVACLVTGTLLALMSVIWPLLLSLTLIVLGLAIAEDHERRAHRKSD